MNTPDRTKPASHPRRTGCLAKVIVFSIALGVSLVVGEWVTRLLWEKEAILFPRYHTRATYGPYQLRRLRPNTTFRHTSADGTWTFTTNSQGFRDTRDWHYERTPGLGRVLVLGDSQAQGFECRQERTFSALLERRLRALGQPAEVLNCGVSGFGTAEQLAFFENEGVKYQPDVVVLAWFTNDADDSVKTGLFAVRDGKLVEEKHEHQPGVAVLDAINRWQAGRWLSEHSYLYSLLFNRLWDLKKNLLSKRANAAATEFAIQAPTPEATAANYQRELTGKLLERLHAACAKAGAKLIIVDTPFWTAIDDFESSLPQGQQPIFEQNCEVFLGSDEVLGKYRHVAEFFVAHGQHHISETTHLLMAMALAEKVAGSKQ